MSVLLMLTKNQPFPCINPINQFIFNIISEHMGLGMGTMLGYKFLSSSDIPKFRKYLKPQI